MSKPYNVCPDCGAHLDPGETCDCKNEKPEQGKAEPVLKTTT